MASQSVRRVLDDFRAKYKGKPICLSWHEFSLRYHATPGAQTVDMMAYPVSIETAREEAKFFGCELTEQ